MRTATAAEATFARRPAPEYGQGVELITVDCVHGTTTVHLLAPRHRRLSDVEVQLAVAAAIDKRYREERCSCARRLRRLYSQEGMG
jgi:hypothetical protein